MGVGWKINMLLEIETREDFIEFIGVFSVELSRCMLISPNNINWQVAELCSPLLVNLKINLKMRLPDLKPILTYNETTQRIVSDTCINRFEGSWSAHGGPLKCLMTRFGTFLSI